MRQSKLTDAREEEPEKSWMEKVKNAFRKREIW